MMHLFLKSSLKSWDAKADIKTSIKKLSKLDRLTKLSLASTLLIALAFGAYLLVDSSAHLQAAGSVQASQLFTYKRLANPAQTIVSDKNGKWLATFTDLTRTVRLLGPSRTFGEPQSTTSTVTHDTWVRVLPQPFNGVIDQGDQEWLTRELNDTTPDVLAIAMQYVDKAPALKVGGLTVAGDASYGPLEAGKRQEGSDFNDYLGVDWQYVTTQGTSRKSVIDHPEPLQIKALDCSGYMRMVWGFRSGMPMADANFPLTSDAINRRAYEIQASAPGIMLNQDTKQQLTDFSKLNIGDIVFFDASKNDGTQIDHNGMYMGRDNRGHYRFISSRKTADGPTMGDVGGASILDGKGFYALAYRSARRF